jgi:hypothetical protein
LTLDVPETIAGLQAASPSILAGARHSRSGNPPTKKGDEAQLLAALRNDEITKLESPTIEDRSTRSPRRYNEEP